SSARLVPPGSGSGRGFISHLPLVPSVAPWGRRHSSPVPHAVGIPFKSWHELFGLNNLVTAQARAPKLMVTPVRLGPMKAPPISTTCPASPPLIVLHTKKE